MLTRALLRSRAGAAAALTLSLCAGCTLLGDFGIAQCHTDRDCKDRGGDFVNTVCNADNICINPNASSGAGGGGTGCSTNQECSTQLGKPARCLPASPTNPAPKCVALLSGDCVEIFPADAYTNDNAIFVGFIGAITGPLKYGGANHFGSVKLALDEMRTQLQGSGLPGGKDGMSRPMVALKCDEVGDQLQAATRSAQHLIDIGAAAIIGPTGSIGVTQISPTTVNAGMFSISGSAGSVSLLSLKTNGVVWSAWPNDIYLEPSSQVNVSQVEKELNAIGVNPIKVAMVHADDTVSVSFAAAVTGTLKFNNMQDVSTNFNNGNWSEVTFSSMAATSEEFIAQVVTPISAFKPDVILVYGGSEFNNQALPLVENSWPTTRKPQWIYFERDPYILTTVSKADQGQAPFTGQDDLLNRVRGGDIPHNELYTAFKQRYLAFNTDITTPGTYSEGTYDATYTLAFSIVAAGDVATENLTGPQIAKGINRLLPGTNAIQQDITPLTIQSIVTALWSSSTTNVDIRGASGYLNFDTTTSGVRSPPTDLSIFCVHKDTTMNPPTYVWQDSGLTYLYQTKTTSGTYTPCN